MTVTVYVYDDTHTVIVNTSANQGSTTMYDKTIKLYQGIDNTVKFALKDNDRNAVDLTSLTVTFNIVDSTTNESILARPLTVTSATKGLAQLNLPASAIDNIAGTFYNYSLYTTNTSSEQQAVFTDLNEAVHGTLEVIEGIASNPRATQVMNMPTPAGAVNNTYYYSNAVSGATERNLTSSLHTVSVYDDYMVGNSGGGPVGTIKIQGCLTATASSNDADWFDIPLEDGWISTNYATNAKGVIEINHPGNLDHPSVLIFKSNAKWIRIAYKWSSIGVVYSWNKALLRN